MKKLLLLFALVAFSASVSAQSGFRTQDTPSHRGFFDVDLSLTSSKNVSSGQVGLTTSQGVQVNPYFFIGAGAGVQVVFAAGESAVAVPVFGHTRVNLTKTQISPYFDVKGGYGFVDAKHGFLEPSFGVSVPVSDNFAINTGLSYNMAFLKDPRVVHSLAINFGFEF